MRAMRPPPPRPGQEGVHEEVAGPTPRRSGGSDRSGRGLCVDHRCDVPAASTCVPRMRNPSWETRGGSSTHRMRDLGFERRSRS